MSSKIQTFYESISLSSFGAIFLLFSLLKLTLPYLLRNKTWQKSHFRSKNEFQNDLRSYIVSLNCIKCKFGAFERRNFCRRRREIFKTRTQGRNHSQKSDSLHVFKVSLNCLTLFHWGPIRPET